MTKGKTINHFPTCTRVEVIDKTGRAYTTYGVKSVQVSIQDDGKTLKLFVYH